MLRAFNILGTNPDIKIISVFMMVLDWDINIPILIYEDS